jgi:hypothetical protein
MTTLDRIIIFASFGMLWWIGCFLASWVLYVAAGFMVSWAVVKINSFEDQQ